MSTEIRTFFRHCPACGRRFHIKLVRKERIGGETIKEQLTATESEMESALIHSTPAPFITPLHEGSTVIVDIEDFQYTYRCTHCGHQWSEMHEKEQTTES